MFKNVKNHGGDQAVIFHAIEHSLCGTVMLNNDGYIVYANPTTFVMWGYENSKDVVGKHFSAFFSSAQTNKIRGGLESARESGTWKETLNGTKKDSSQIFVTVMVSHITNAENAPIGFSVSILDTTDYHDALRDVVISEMQYRSTLDYMVDIIITIDRNFTVVLANKATDDWSKKIDAPEGLKLGKNLFAVFPFLPEKMKKEYKTVFKTGETMVTEEVFTFGAARYVARIRKIPVFSNEGITHVITFVRDITEQKISEEALKKSEEKYRLIADNVPVGIFIHVDGVIRYGGNEAIRLIGFDNPDEIIGRNILEFIHEDDRQMVIERTRKRALGEDEPSGYEARMFKKDGSIFPVLVYGNKIDYFGETAIQGVFIDISKRKEAEKEVEKAREHLHATLNALPDILFEVDREGRIYDFRAPNPEILYVPPDQIIGKTVRGLLPEDAATVIMNAIKNASISGRFTGSVYSLSLPTGVSWFELSIASKGDPIAPDARFIALVRDITEKKVAEEALRESEEKWRNLFENSIEAVFTVDLKGKFASVNRAMELISGYDRDELIGKNYANFVGKGDKDILLKKFNALYKTGENIFNLINTMIHKNGKERTVESFATIIRKGNRITGFQGTFRDITERMAAERNLKESERKYRELVENIADIIYVIDDSGKIIFCNQALERLFGYSAEEIIGKNYRDLVGNKAYSQTKEIFKRYLLGRETGAYELRINDKYGNEKIMETREAIVWKNNRIHEIHGFGRDITERKQSEEEVIYLKNFNENIIDHMVDSIDIIDSDYKMIFQNRVSRETFGDGKGMICYEFYHNADKPCSYCTASLSIQTKEKYVREIKLDNNKYLEIHSTPVLMPDGTYCSLEIIKDITNRKEAEEALRYSEEKFRNLFETSRDALYLSSTGGKFIDINPSCKEILGYSREELLAMQITDIYKDKNDRKLFRKAIEENGYVQDYEIDFKKKDGTILNCLMTSSLRRERDGTILGYQGIIRDITEKKKLESQLVQAQKMEAMGSLAGGIAHNFNNILVGIMGYSEYLLYKHDKEDSNYHALKTIHESAIKASNLTKQLLNIGRGGEFKSSKMSLNEVVNHTLPLIKGTISKTIEIDRKLDSSLEAMNGDLWQLEQCLLNICINANDAMPKGGKLAIETYNILLGEDFKKNHFVSNTGYHVVLSVTDTGIGMSQEVKDHIFEPFFTTKDKTGGTGMGLATVYGIVKNHRGFISVYSEPNEGTTFKLFFPAIGAGVIEKKTAEGKERALGTEAILLVDDEPIVLEMWEEVLTDLGYKVISVEEGSVALDLLKWRNDEIKLVILDYIMPGLGGRETFLKIKELYPHIKVLITSGYSENGKIGEILNDGADGFIQKPVQLKEFSIKIREVLDKK